MLFMLLKCLLLNCVIWKKACSILPVLIHAVMLRSFICYVINVISIYSGRILVYNGVGGIDGSDTSTL